MIPLFAPHTGTHRAVRPARRRPAVPASFPAAGPAAPGHDLLTDAELAALIPGGLQPHAYPPFDETEAGVWPGRAGRVETTLLAEAKDDCPNSSSGGHYYVNQGGTWTCELCGRPR